MTSIIKGNIARYKVTIEFQDQHDYDEFIEMQKEYPKLRRFCEAFENELRNWRKHDVPPDQLRGIDMPPGAYSILANEIERWYYSVKEEWTHD